ncbi:MAG: pitrilysin family protein [Alphaproteobacteria bacterium]|jgi:zinc protease|nr:pitrilysin family protein [Alphaproteobacteria bacterium]
MAVLTRTTAWKNFLLSGFFAGALVLSSPADASVFSPTIYDLANGVRLIVVENPLSDAVGHMVWYRTGAADEPDGKTGLAHYLEHMMFKGTAKHPAGSFDAIIARLGGDQNAYTSYDTTAYYEIVPAKNLALVMSLEADRMRGLLIEENEAQSEKNVVLSEREERTGNSSVGAFREELRRVLFPLHPYGRPIIGLRKDVERLTPDDLRAFYRKAYAPQNAVVVVSGNVKHDQVAALAAATYGRLGGGLRPKQPPKISQISHPLKPLFIKEDARVKQPFVTRQYVVSSALKNRQDSLALDVLSEVLTGGEVGILYRHFVIKTRTASGTSAGYNGTTRGPSVFSITASPTPGQTVEHLNQDIAAYLQYLAHKGLKARDVEEAKQRLLDSAVFARDKLLAPAQILGEAEAVGLGAEMVEKWPDNIRRVSTAQVNAALQRLVSNKNMVAGILKPPAMEEKK